MARTPSISIILLPKEFTPLPPVILGHVPSILSHQGRGNPKPSPRAGEGEALASGEGYFKNRQQVLSKCFKSKPETSYLSPHPAGCGRRVSMTLLPKATHIDIALAMSLWILRHGTSSREYRRRMTLKLVLEKRGNVPPAGLFLPLTRSNAPTSPARGEVVNFVLNALLPKVSFFLPNTAKTC